LNHSDATIANNAITVSSSYAGVSVGDSNTVSTINGGSIGKIILLEAAVPNRPVVVQHKTGNVGNVLLNNRSDCTLQGCSNLKLIYTPDSVWLEMSRTTIKAQPTLSFTSGSSTTVLMGFASIDLTQYVTSTNPDSPLMFLLSSDTTLATLNGTVLVPGGPETVQVMVSQSETTHYYALSPFALSFQFQST
jgi:hypothetical protein